MSITTITSKGQVTIPKDIRDALGLGQGDKVLFSVETDHVVLTPCPGDAWVTYAPLCLPAGPIRATRQSGRSCNPSWASA